MTSEASKKVEHTPGPWSFSLNSGFDVFEVAGNHVVSRGWHGDRRVLEGNARLIAAAPEMLDELDEILSWAEVEKAPLREAELASIRKVIRKARGEA